MEEIKEDWAKFIISEALASIHKKEDIRREIKEVEKTAVGARPDLMKKFLKLVELKKKTLDK